MIRGAMFLALPLALGAGALTGQVDEGNGLSTVGGATLGLYAGGFFGVVGSLLPCDRTVRGRACVAISGVGGAALGLIGGGVMGYEDGAEVGRRARGAAYGALIGAPVGLVLQQAVRQYAWTDALLVAAFGAAVGAAPRGTLIGSGVGALIGSAAWAFSPRGGLQDLIMFTLVGSALGGLYDLAAGAVDARRDTPPTFSATFSIGLG